MLFLNKLFTPAKDGRQPAAAFGWGDPVEGGEKDTGLCLLPNATPRTRGPDDFTGGASRTLIYLPIIDTQADMGALKAPVVRATMEKLGRAGLARHLAAIDQVWAEIEAFIHGLARPLTGCGSTRTACRSAAGRRRSLRNWPRRGTATIACCCA